MDGYSSPVTAPIRCRPLARAAPIPEGARSAELMRHGSMILRYYQPRGHDAQTPHDQDEIYIVASGSGQFMLEGERRPFGPGDALFAPAGADHRFEDFSDDFGVWNSRTG